MRQAIHQLTVETDGKGVVEITRPVLAWVAAQGIGTGLLTLWCRHTSASLTVQENAAPAVHTDIERFFEALAPEDSTRYAHDDEGPDDMPAHLRTMLTDTSLTIPVAEARPLLGTWQGLYVFEHRRRPQRRAVVLHLIGD
jgi:secondary thiamine-phosphate synthase enzyme